MIINIILVLGILIAIIPFFGVSHATKEILTALLGLVVAILAFSSERHIITFLARQSRKMDRGNGNDQGSYQNDGVVGVPMHEEKNS